MVKYLITYKITDGSDNIISSELFAEDSNEAIKKFRDKFGKSVQILNMRQIHDDGTISSITYYVDVPTMTKKEEDEFVKKMTEELKRAVGL